MSGSYKVAWLCEALLVSRSGYYDWVERRRQPSPRQRENTRLRERIRVEFVRSRRTYGSPRLAQALGCPGRRNRIARLMRGERLFARQRSKYRHATTDSRHGGPIAPNRLQGLIVQGREQVWVTDATGILTGQGWLYLVAVLDLHSRRVLGWAMSPILDAPLVIAALRMALAQRRSSGPLILHSDRALAYRSPLQFEQLFPSNQKYNQLTSITLARLSEKTMQAQAFSLGSSGAAPAGRRAARSLGRSRRARARCIGSIRRQWSGLR